ncbi:MAG: restriction endonuclease subunit S [Tannerellaceae bacterium]|nr:restriction endonuclease subunit S [Tannerellaceae bacterium]
MAERKLQPQLRFPGFEGEWFFCKIGDIFEISAGGDITKDHVSPNQTDIFKYPIYANTVENNGLYAYSDIYRIEPNVITVTGRGVNIGIAQARNHRFYPIVRLLVLKPKNQEDIFFFEYCINRMSIFVESTGVPQLTAPQISSYTISYPKVSEQQKIASFLTTVDKRITLLTQKKEKLEQYKKGVMQKIFNREIRFKDENGNDFPEWEKQKLEKYLVEFKEKTTINNQYPVLTSSRNGIFLQTDYYKHQVASEDNTGYNIVPRGFFTYRHMSDDIIFKFNINTLVDYGIVSTLYPVFTTNNIDDRFLLFSLNEGKEFKRYAILQKQGGSRTYIYFNKLKDLLITLPILEEQQKIASFLSAIDKQLENVGREIDAMKEWKKGLLQQLFV